MYRYRIAISIAIAIAIALFVAIAVALPIAIPLSPVNYFKTTCQKKDPARYRL